jgi:transposase
MLTVRNGFQEKLHMVTIEDLVPADHFLRKADKVLDLFFVYEEARHLYSKTGRPSIDPVLLVKYLLVGFLYGIPSERRIEQEIQVNMAYRWFLGLDLDERVPDHSTISQLRRRKLNGTDLFRKLFERALAVCIDKGLVDGKLILTDSTHLKANASKRSEIKVEVEKSAVAYWERLDKYEAAEREKLEREGKISPKKPRGKHATPSKAVEKTVSTTDPDAGRLNRPGKPEGMHYLDHQSIDAKSGIIVDVHVTAGNVADCVPYLERIETVGQNLNMKIEAVAVDSGYDTSLIHKELDECGITIFTPEKAVSGTSKAEFGRAEFTYDGATDRFICPNGEALPLARLQRNESTITREYRAATRVCGNCPFREKCLSPSQKYRRIQVNIFEEVVKKHHAIDSLPECREALKKRQIWSEGTFAAQKARHNLKQVLRRGLEAAQTHCLLSATAMNLKRLVKCTAV